MATDLLLGENWEISLCVLYVLGAIASIWLIILSPILIDWMGADMYRNKKDRKNWPTIFLVIAIFQPVTFIASAIGLWWVGYMAILPPIHLGVTFFTFLAIDFFRDETKWEIERRKLLGK